MDNCKHVPRISPARDHSILNPQKWLCVECGTTESVWVRTVSIEMRSKGSFTLIDTDIDSRTPCIYIVSANITEWKHFYVVALKTLKILICVGLSID